MSRVQPYRELKKPCPVCGMDATQIDLWRSYRGVRHFFCSQQCVDRFIAHPSLYCGDPKHGMSEKQKGRIEIRRHKIVFSDPLSSDHMANVAEAVRSMMGIKNMNVSRDAFFVTYDLLEVSLEEIEKTIERVLGKIDSPMIDHVKRGWIHYTEECELENLAHPSKEGGCH